LELDLLGATPQYTSARILALLWQGQGKLEMFFGGDALVTFARLDLLQDYTHNQYSAPFKTGSSGTGASVVQYTTSVCVHNPGHHATEFDVWRDGAKEVSERSLLAGETYWITSQGIEEMKRGRHLREAEAEDASHESVPQVVDAAALTPLIDATLVARTADTESVAQVGQPMAAVEVRQIPCGFVVVESKDELDVMSVCTVTKGGHEAIHCERVPRRFVDRK
jgi:hypothetical protein